MTNFIHLLGASYVGGAILLLLAVSLIQFVAKLYSHRGALNGLVSQQYTSTGPLYLSNAN